ncbi:MAG: alpha/beta fold hydrolase, partial [Bacteroidota bacterium]
MVSDLLQSIPDYRPPLLHRSAFLSSVLPNKLRKPQAPVYTRQRAELPDGDFIDLDWIQQGNSRLAILMHGLEGSSQSTYIRGMAGALARNGYDVLAMNHRSCSEEMNRLPVAYHAGRTQDLLWTVEHLTTAYSRVVVIGYSLGANMSLVAAGRDQLHQFTQVKAVVAVSVPCDLLESSAMWNQRRFSVILPYFVKQLRTKVERKKALLPDLPVDMNAIARSKTFFDFDDH